MAPLPSTQSPVPATMATTVTDRRALLAGARAPTLESQPTAPLAANQIRLCVPATPGSTSTVRNARSAPSAQITRPPSLLATAQALQAQLRASATLGTTATAERVHYAKRATLQIQSFARLATQGARRML